MIRAAVLFLCTVLCTSYARPMHGAEPPGEQITIPGRKAPEPAVLSNAITVAAGRFVPLCPPDGVPSFLAQSPAWRVYSLKAGDKFVGVQYDAADGAEQETYTWTTPVYVLLTRPLAGTYSLQFLKNGPADVGPVVNGAPLTLTIQGPRPPPVPPTPPVPPDPLFAAAQAAYAADPSATKAADKVKLAAAYRALAGSVSGKDVYRDQNGTALTITTAGELFTVIKGAADKMIGNNLRTTRAVFGSALGAVESTDPKAVLTTDQKAKAVDLLTRFAAVLEGL